MAAGALRKLCFVCMGNICRSPLAAAVFRHKVVQRGAEDQFIIDSAGTGGWHCGDLPDPRARQVALRRGIPMDSVARQIQSADFARFDLFLCMDERNREHLLEMGGSPQKVRLLLSYDPHAKAREVPDPYYGGQDGFETVYRLVDSACAALLDELLRK